MTSSEIRKRFLEFFEKRQHSILESASLVTSDEKGITNPTLFNTAGMQPLIPYLLGKEHPMGKRLADAQKCLRTVDIDEIGDNTHATFFEMLGNWSLGDYFKKEAINWSYQFLTSQEEGLGLDPNRLYITVFEGDSNAERDIEARQIWEDIFKEKKVKGYENDTPKDGADRIFFMSANSNWWQAGENGPCGPDTEMYYDVANKFSGKCLTKEQFLEADSKREVVEIWNDVFMQYEKKDGKIIGKLPKPSVDTGAGLERLAMVMQEVDNIYATDLLKPLMDKIKELSDNWQEKSARIVADHIRASVFLIADGVTPSNTDRGYVLRRLLRRAIRHTHILDLKYQPFQMVDQIFSIYKTAYPEISKNKQLIEEEIKKETERFNRTIDTGLKEFDKIAKGNISGIDAFTLFSSYGLPIDLTTELAKEKGLDIDIKGFEEEFKKHQELSRVGAEKKFTGGLADNTNEMVVRYHTATHLLHQALNDILGNGVMQKGSNITSERLRFDFAHTAKMTDEEKKKVEEIVNSKIKEALPVNQVKMSKEEAEKTNAKHFFGEKYGDEISIYYVGNDIDSAYSKEFCGGPHVHNTKDLSGPEGKWTFKILKEEAVAQGTRRIKAVIQ